MEAHIPEERKILILQIEENLKLLAERRIVDTFPIDDWEMAIAGVEQPPRRAPQSGWNRFRMGDQWGEGKPDYTVWFRSQFRAPKEFRDPDAYVELHLDVAREGLVYFNGKPIQGLSKNHRSIRLVKPSHLEKPVRVEIEAYTEAVRNPPPSYHGKFERAELRQIDRKVDEFYWDLRVALDTVKSLGLETRPALLLLDLLSWAMTQIHPLPADREGLSNLAAKIGGRLRRKLNEFPSDPALGKLRLHGHSHIDTAWLWPLVETRRKCGRTFSTALQLMEVNPEFCFSQGQPQLYQYTKENYPEVYQAIKKRVQEGRWDPAGPAWVEMDSNLSGGEAIVRQLLYGNLFFEREFGLRNPVCWLPDAFGYNWNLPQILKKCGIEIFLTTKIDWSMVTVFPYTVFHWEGPDGTRILGMMPPLNYNGNLVPGEAKKQWDLVKQKNLFEEAPFSFGWGDGGGGPTQEMIENGRRLSNLVGIPRCRFGTLTGYCNDLLDSVDEDRLPVWNGELYLELHRACQISQARTKRNNRKMEVQLRDTEFLASLSYMMGRDYPSAELEETWRDVLTNQFHDILPGSAVESVYREADETYAQARRKSETLFDRSFDILSKSIDTRGEGTPILLFNTLSWERNDPVAVRVADWASGEDVRVLDPDGETVLHQWSKDEVGNRVLWIEPRDVPSMGHSVYRLAPGEDEPSEVTLKVSENRLENEFFRLDLDRKGTIRRLFDKRFHRDVLAPGERANQLQMFHDVPHMHDAWDYDFNVDENRWEWDDLRSVKVAEKGPVRASVKIERRSKRSKLEQRIVLYHGIPRIDFETRVDWGEKRVLLKAAFPVNVLSSKATYEIQFATIERTTHRNTPFDRARFEVPHLRWADLSEGDYGVAVANDCKYGFDVSGDVMRLSLLRSPVSPDPHADEGFHEFVYSLVPHGGDWRKGEVVQRAMELNVPLLARPAKSHRGVIPSRVSWFGCDSPNVVFETLKKAERTDELVIRLYETHGCRGPIVITTSLPIAEAMECNLMEDRMDQVRVKNSKIRLQINPYEIRTLLLKIEQASDFTFPRE